MSTARSAVLVAAVPVVIGIVGWSSRDRGFRWLWIWLAFGLAVNVVMWRMGAQSQRTSVLVQLTYPVFATLGLCTIATLAGSRRITGWCGVAGAAYLLFWLWRMLHREADGDFSIYTGPVLWMVLTVGAIAMTVSRLRTLTSSPLRDPVVIVGFAVLVSYAPGAALEPLSGMIWTSHPELTYILWIVRSCLLIIGSLLFTLALQWMLPPRLQSGSSPSSV